MQARSLVQAGRNRQPPSELQAAPVVKVPVPRKLAFIAVGVLALPQVVSWASCLKPPMKALLALRVISCAPQVVVVPLKPKDVGVSAPSTRLFTNEMDVGWPVLGLRSTAE